jgi:hypothetical protein
MKTDYYRRGAWQHRLIIYLSALLFFATNHNQLSPIVQQLVIFFLQQFSHNKSSSAIPITQPKIEDRPAIPSLDREAAIPSLDHGAALATGPCARVPPPASAASAGGWSRTARQLTWTSISDQEPWQQQARLQELVVWNAEGRLAETQAQGHKW